MRAAYKTGAELYGDDFSPDDIAEWFASEQLGYYDTREGVGGTHTHALNARHGFRHLGEHYENCLTLGCADGDELLPIAGRVGKFIAVEPAKPWWRDKIGRTPAEYRMPEQSGALDLPDQSVELVLCFSVLHHIPNVSAVLRELARVAKPGTLMLIKEPSSAMGDWTRPRPGLTKNERGIAPQWMVRTAAAQGWTLRRLKHCDSGPVRRGAMALGNLQPFNSPTIVALDSIVCAATKFLHRYWRTNPFHKLAPGLAYYVFERARS